MRRLLTALSGLWRLVPPCLLAAALGTPWAARAAGDAAESAHAQAQDRMRAELMSDARIRAGYVEVYLEKQRTDLANERVEQQKLLVDLARYKRDAQSSSDDLDSRRRTLDAYSVFDALIFVLVVAVVSAGLWFSHLQFSVDRRGHAEARRLLLQLAALQPDDALRPLLAARLEALGQKAVNTFEAGPIKVSSPVIGLVVLATSLAFFYLYLTHVYKVQELSSPVPQADKPAAAASAVPSAASR